MTNANPVHIFVQVHSSLFLKKYEDIFNLFHFSKLVFVIITKGISGTVLSSLPELPNLSLRAITHGGPCYPVCMKISQITSLVLYSEFSIIDLVFFTQKKKEERLCLFISNTRG